MPHKADTENPSKFELAAALRELRQAEDALAWAKLNEAKYRLEGFRQHIKYHRGVIDDCRTRLAFAQDAADEILCRIP